MAMLKTLYRKHGGCKQIKNYIENGIKNYLEKGSRNLAYDYSDLIIDRENWAQQFDDTRKSWGKDEGRKYYHIIISPDPQDNCSLETLRDLATSWMLERYSGKEYVIGYHNDNGHMHAHIVMNSVDPMTGYKINMSNKDIVDDTMTLQRMCKERGLAYFTNPRPVKDSEGYSVTKGDIKHPAVVLTEAEKRLIARGITPWKQEIRNAIDLCATETRNWDGFVKAMAAQNVSIKVDRRNVVTYTLPPDAKGRKRVVRGTERNLGSAYTLKNVLGRMQKVDGRTYTGFRMPDEPTIAIPKTAEQIIEQRGQRRPWIDPQKTLDLLTIMRKNGFSNVGELDAALQKERDALDEVRHQIDEAKIYIEVVGESKQKIERYLDMRDGRSADIATVAGFFEFSELEGWIELHDIDPDTHVEKIRPQIEQRRQELDELNHICTEHEQTVSALYDAMKTARRLGMSVPEPETTTARRTNQQRWQDYRHITSREDLARFNERLSLKSAERFEASGYENLKALAQMQREIVLRKQQEIIARQREAQRQAQQLQELQRQQQQAFMQQQALIQQAFMQQQQTAPQKPQQEAERQQTPQQGRGRRL